MSEKYVAENFEYAYKGNKILNDLKEKNMELMKKNEQLELELAQFKIKRCECGGELSFEKELNCEPKMAIYNCNECHQNKTLKLGE
jgi:hypothetical protein